jgi:hypothetical protein
MKMAAEDVGLVRVLMDVKEEKQRVAAARLLIYL